MSEVKKVNSKPKVIVKPAEDVSFEYYKMLKEQYNIDSVSDYTPTKMRSDSKHIEIKKPQIIKDTEEEEASSAYYNRIKEKNNFDSISQFNNPVQKAVAKPLTSEARAKEDKNKFTEKLIEKYGTEAGTAICKVTASNQSCKAVRSNQSATDEPLKLNKSDGSTGSSYYVEVTAKGFKNIKSISEYGKTSNMLNR